VSDRVPPGPCLRPAGAEDLPAIAAIHAASWRSAYRDVLPADYLAGPVESDLLAHWQGVRMGGQDVVLVAGAGDPTGFIAVWCRPDPIIDNLHVLPGCRSGGIGTALMRGAAAALTARGHDTASLWVFTANARAVRFYERLGGKVAERTEKEVFGHRVPSLRMVWEGLGPLLLPPEA
jgi:ribosomal protein S18 acetylase RimI-like enzyme